MRTIRMMFLQYKIARSYASPIMSIRIAYWLVRGGIAPVYKGHMPPRPMPARRPLQEPSE